MFYKAKQMLKKARQGKHGSHPTILSRWYEQEEYRKSLAEHNINEKEIMLFDRIALKDTTFQLRELTGCRTPNIGFFVWILMGLKRLFDSDQNLPLR